MKISIRILSLYSAILIFGCTEKQPPYITLEGNAQGTTFRVVYADAQQRNFEQNVDSIFRAIDHSMSLWDSTSIITKINKNDTTAKPDAAFMEVFNESQRIAKITDGAFDITVGPLVKRWGFSYKKGLPLPTDAQVDSLKHYVGYEKISIEDGQLKKVFPEMEVDFNAIAQGYTVDVIANWLETKGIVNYLVEIGGEVRAKGKNDRNEIWKIGIDKPLENGERAIQTVVELPNHALATSGSYRKFTIREGKKFSHTLDPKTGKPVTHNLLSASVLAKNCTLADAFATACMVIGKEKALQLAKQEGFEVYLISSTHNGGLEISKSEGFKTMD